MVGSGAWGLVELLRSPRCQPVPVSLCSTSQANVASDTTPQIAKGPRQVDPYREASRTVLGRKWKSDTRGQTNALPSMHVGRRPEGGAGCLSGPVRICAGGAGQPAFLPR